MEDQVTAKKSNGGASFPAAYSVGVVASLGKIYHENWVCIKVSD